MTMNSWKSILLSACLPPLMMLAIGTGRTRALDAADVAVERQVVGRGRGFGGGQADAQDRVGAELSLVGVPSASISARSKPDLVGRIASDGDFGQHGVDVGDRLGHAFA